MQTEYREIHRPPLLLRIVRARRIDALEARDPLMLTCDSDSPGTRLKATAA